MAERVLTRTIIAAIFAAVFVSLPTFADSKIDWDALEKKAQQYTGKKISGGSDSSDEEGSEGKKSVNLTIPSSPTGRFIDPGPKTLSVEDTRHVTARMKLANLNFKNRRYDNAIKYIDEALEREPDHPGARFMRAVIAARKGDHLTAWQNILIARERDGENPKVKSFISKLETRMPQPQSFVSVPGIYRPNPKMVGEKSFDIIERFLREPVSQNLVNFSTEEFEGGDNNALMPIKMTFSAPHEADAIMAVFKTATGEMPQRSDNDPKSLSLKLKISGVPLKNPEVKTISGHVEFVKETAEETDVAISDSAERDKENKVLEITYEIASRDFASLNNFVRKITPYAHTCRVIEMKLAYITGSEQIIWKGKIRVDFQL